MNEFLILFILKINAANIYEIKKYIDTNFAPFLEVSTGAIIPALKRLEASGDVISEKVMTDGGLRRTIYTITDKGIEEIDRYLKAEIVAAPQLLRRETEVLLLLLDNENFSDIQKNLLLQKVKNALDNNVKSLTKQIKYGSLNSEFLNMELVYQEAKLRMLDSEKNEEILTDRKNNAEL